MSELRDPATCDHGIIDRFMAGWGDDTLLWACRECRIRFYPACPTCVDVGHRSGHPAAARPPEVDAEG